jgi:hypothetical protein
VPGDDWDVSRVVTNAAGATVNVSGWTVWLSKIEWADGSIDLTIDMAEAASGILRFKVDKSVTASLPIGQVSALTIRATSPGGFDQTIYYAPINGLRFKRQGE